MNTKLLVVLERLSVKLYRMDRSNKYILKKDWKIIVNLPCPALYDGSYIRLAPNGDSQTILTVKAPGICDGASYAPDWIPGATEGALVHDPIYHELAGITRAWQEADPGITSAYVREWGDKVFAAVMSHYRAGWWRRPYFRAVRALGGVFQWAKRFFVLVALAGVMVAIAGCAVPDKDLVIIEEDPEYSHESVAP